MIVCLLTCNDCGMIDAPVSVPPRLAGQDAKVWFRIVLQPAMDAAHRLRSPLCRNRTMTYVKIPMPKTAEQVSAEAETMAKAIEDVIGKSRDQTS